MEEKIGEWRTRAAEDFLRTVYTLQQTRIPVSVIDLSRVLRIAPSAITDMIRRLGPRQLDTDLPHTICALPAPLVDHKPYHGVWLTAEGEQIALQVIRRRRLLELFLVETLGYTWDEVDQEADRLEHDLSEKLTDRLAAHLSNPTVDPHGDPIPTANGVLLAASEDTTLIQMVVGEQGQITRIVDYSPELLHYLGDLGLRPNVEIVVTNRSPIGDTITVQVSGSDKICTLSAQLAKHIYLTRLRDELKSPRNNLEPYHSVTEVQEPE